MRAPRPHSSRIALVLLVLALVGACASAADESTVDAATDPAPVEADSPDVLPQRAGAPEETTGGVPHVQTSAVRASEFATELERRAYLLPGVENRESTVTLPGAMSLWLSSELELARSDILPAGREFGHIHPDGSMHLWLPADRAREVAQAQWGELHPWVDRAGFWDGVVMVWTPESADDVDVAVQLIVDAYNLVVGADLEASDFQ